MQKSTFFLENLRWPDLYLPHIHHEGTPVFQQVHLNIQHMKSLLLFPLQIWREMHLLWLGQFLKAVR